MQCNCLKYNYLIFRTPLKLDNYIDKYLWDFMIAQVNGIKKTIKAGIFLIFY